MSLRAAIARATDAAGRIHWTRSLAAAIDEADARLVAPSPARRWALARELEEALGVGDTMGDEQLDRAVESVRALRERAEKAERERDEARAAYDALRAAVEAWRDVPPCPDHGAWEHESTCEACARDVQLADAMPAALDGRRAAREHEARVRATALREAADRIGVGLPACAALLRAWADEAEKGGA